MTVKELIEELRLCNGDAEVYMDTGDYNLANAEEVATPKPGMVVIS